MSDIWNEFEKIAVAQGLISVEAADEENNPRPNVQWDSLADDAVRLLYNIEPEPEKKKSIIELAHPETFVVGRAYDAMNAVVENEEQRQAMMTYIALKQPNGHLTQRRYVETKKDLLDSLIRSAFTLDNQNEESLMSLADSCAERLGDREIKKEAAAPLVVGIGAAAAAILGMGYYFFYGAPPAESVLQNSAKVIEALQALSNRAYAAPIRKDMATLVSMAKQVYAVKQQLIPIHSVNESISAATQENEKKQAEIAHRILTNYMQQLMLVQEAIPRWVSAIKAMSSEDTEERGEWSAKWHAITKSFTDTLEEKLIYALEGKEDLFAKFMPGKAGSRGGLKESIEHELEKFQGAVDVAKEKAPEIQKTIAAQADALATPTQPEKKPVPANMPIAQNAPARQPTPAELNDELVQLLNKPGENALPVAASDDFLNYLSKRA